MDTLEFILVYLLKGKKMADKKRKEEIEKKEKIEKTENKKVKKEKKTSKKKGKLLIIILLSVILIASIAYMVFYFVNQSKNENSYDDYMKKLKKILYQKMRKEMLGKNMLILLLI